MSQRVSEFHSFLSLTLFCYSSLVAQTVKHLSTMRETRVQSLGWEDPLEKEMAIHSRTIACKIPWTEEPGKLQSMGSQRDPMDCICFVAYTQLSKRTDLEMFIHFNLSLDFPGGSDSKASVCNAGDPGLIPGLGRSPGEGNENPHQNSVLDNAMDRGAYWAIVHGAAKRET